MTSLFASKRLLAKSNGEQTLQEIHTLPGHTAEVLRAAGEMATFLIDPLDNAIGFGAKDAREFSMAVILAAWAHDWGKANDHFQQMIRDSTFKQGIRHEIVSFQLFVEFEKELAFLLEPLSDWARDAIFYAILGHHLKFPDPLTERNGTALLQLLPSLSIIRISRPPGMRETSIWIFLRIPNKAHYPIPCCHEACRG